MSNHILSDHNNIAERRIAEIQNFSIRLKNSLYLINVKKVSELAKLSKRDLIITPGIGKKGRLCIEDFLNKNQTSARHPTLN